jgi:hypothetical protein
MAGRYHRPGLRSGQRIPERCSARALEAERRCIGSDPEKQVERLRELEQLGPTVIVLQNNSGADSMRAIEVYGEQVLPALRGARV